ncbi:MAG TPA: ATP-binding protein, partial [Verrucomicrobiae bacterium]|nr:ATP-binding protein [Verrucomicrobiae bacterium]
ATDPRFEIEPTAIDQIQEGLSTNHPICVHGIVRRFEAGKWVVIWDSTGQVTLQTRQTQPLRPGEAVEAIGYPAVLGVQHTLRNGFYRPGKSATALNASPGQQAPNLRIAAQIRELNTQDAARSLPVFIRGLVTFSHTRTSMAYVQDDSGGIRIVNPRWDSPDTSKPGTIVEVEGTTAEGNFVPLVTNAVLRRVGWWSLDAEKGPLITLEQALTGHEEGRWVQMEGYVRSVTEINGLRHIELTTSSGEFEAWVPSTRTLKFLEGAIARVQGVCAASANARHQLTGIQIWIPESKYILVQEPEAADIFSVPLRNLDSLRRFSTDTTLHHRIRTAGTVVLHVPGRYLSIQDGEDSVFALSRQKEVLNTGDRVEVVGFPGNQGRKFLLREAVFHRVMHGNEPAPIDLPPMHTVNQEWEGRLARAEGTLLNAAQKNGETRILIHSKASAFEASLESTPLGSPILADLQPGSRLAVTGVYEVQSDEYGTTRSFLLRMRSPADVLVLQRPPWWTLARLLWVLLGVLTVSVLALAWGFAIAHKNSLLRQAQDQLEHRVEERTRELELQVAAKERARAELAEAQENLVLTSRQAGMAEVATGVLHNVGNVLNSVNISADTLKERLRNSPVETIGKVSALLKTNLGRIAEYLTRDSKGKALPDYLEKLGTVLTSDKQEMQNEVKLLVKNIDHIKIIVAMQQSYAKIGGVLEELDAKDLIEDALQINSGSFEREQIQVTRLFQSVPPVMVDRHKALQILVNLLSNAKYALREIPSHRTITLSISSPSADQVQIAITDNGIGIALENIGRIFSQGFTTRKDGHGFGLHSGANAAKELGGSLSVYSQG